MAIDRTPYRAWLSKKGAILWNRGAPELQHFDRQQLRTWRESDMCAVPSKGKGAAWESLSSALIRRVERSKLLGGEVLAGKLTTTVIKNRFNRLLATTRGLESTVAGSGSGDVTKHDQNLLDKLRAVAKDIEEFAQLQTAEKLRIAKSRADGERAIDAAVSAFSKARSVSGKKSSQARRQLLAAPLSKVSAAVVVSDVDDNGSEGDNNAEDDEDGYLQVGLCSRAEEICAVSDDVPESPLAKKVIRRKHRKSKSKVSVVDRAVEKIGKAITDIHRKEEAATNAAAIAMDTTLLVDAMKEGDVAMATALQSIGGTSTKVDELEKRLTTGLDAMERHVEDINGKADMILGLLAKLV
jgi:hypothetical protein